ncbi:response regulator transcription factor [Pantoea sp. BRR-3P]|uniref:response regulator transcription factor n=1 Tax=Pantoea sp. BRR-3P TaxID=3141541 RepID=UPI0031F5B948
MHNSSPYSAIIVDDHPVVRMAIEMLLLRENIAVTGKAHDGAEALQLVKNLTPNLMILDIAIPVLNGLEVISRVHAMGYPVKILVFTSQTAASFVSRCRLGGASGFVEKTEEMDDLLDAIRAIRSGYTFFPAEKMPADYPAGSATGEESAKLAQLSDREMMVLIYLAKGYSNIEIAEVLTLSNKTISTYKTRLLQKLGVKTLVDLIGIAHRNHLTD